VGVSVLPSVRSVVGLLARAKGEEEAARQVATEGEAAEGQTLGVAPVDPTDLFEVTFSALQQPEKTPTKEQLRRLDQLAQQGSALLGEGSPPPEEEVTPAPSPRGAVSTLDATIDNIPTILATLASKYPRASLNPNPLVVQTAEDRRAAATLFTPGGDPDNFRRTVTRIA
jgi:hypothetical protein